MDGNGARRRALRSQVLAEETACALCGETVDKTLTYAPGQHSARCTDLACPGCIPHPQRPEVDEDLPRALGGSPYDRSNCHLMHRECNRWKGTMTLAQARAKRAGLTSASSAPIVASPGW